MSALVTVTDDFSTAYPGPNSILTLPVLTFDITDRLGPSHGTPSHLGTLRRLDIAYPPTATSSFSSPCFLHCGSGPRASLRTELRSPHNSVLMLLAPDGPHAHRFQKRIKPALPCPAELCRPPRRFPNSPAHQHSLNVNSVPGTPPGVGTTTVKRTDSLPSLSLLSLQIPTAHKIKILMHQSLSTALYDHFKCDSAAPLKLEVTKDRSMSDKSLHLKVTLVGAYRTFNTF